MIRTEAEYARAKERLDADKAYLEQLRAALSQADLSEEAITRSMQPALSFHVQHANRGPDPHSPAKRAPAPGVIWTSKPAASASSGR